MGATTISLLAITGTGLVISWFTMPQTWARLLLGASRKAAGLRSRYCTVEGVRWHYLEGGTGPTLLLIHGFGADADNWLMIARRLGKHFHIIAPDLPGFGTSSCGESLRYDTPSQAARIVRFMKTAGHTPSFIAGSSMGGWIAATLAQQHYRTLKGLWLIAPLGVKSSKQSEMLEAIGRGDGSPIHLQRLGDFEEQVYRPMFVKAPALPFPLKRLYALRTVHRSPRAIVQFRQILSSAESLESTLQHVAAPVLLQWGDCDRAVDISGASILEHAVADIEVHVQHNVGHLPMLETPEYSCRIFLDFTGLS